MRIGELARRSGLTASRIRFYESIGLLRSVERLPNGFRSYPPETVSILRVITTAQRSGFTLDEIRILLPEDLQRWDHPKLLGVLRHRIDAIEAMRAQLGRTRDTLVALVDEIEARPDGIDCAENAKRVMSSLDALVSTPGEPDTVLPVRLAAER